MKRFAIVLTITAIILSACQNGKPTEKAEEENIPQDTTKTAIAVEESVVEYNNKDAFMHGLLGKVKNVKSVVYTTYEDGSQIKEGSEYENYELVFDKWGHVTLDQWNNKYGYDAKGNFYRGNHTYTKVERDKQGRIVKYVDKDSEQYSESDCNYEFKYSKNGQLVGIKKIGMTDGKEETLGYKGNSIFPETKTQKLFFEGEEGYCIITTTYKYNNKDEAGNWTDRTCVVNEQTTTTEYNEETQQEEVKTDNSTKIYIEKRIIDYYD